MGPHLELKGRFSIMEVPANKENGNALREPVDKHISCASNYEDDIFEMEVSLAEQAEQVNRGDHSEVNIVECTPPGDNPLVETESEDATENSSSFGNTASGDENDAVLSDNEVISKFHGDAKSSMDIDGSGEVFRMRKKKLTSHWKAYIQCHMWRCKWVELQIRRFKSQALKYDLLLAKNNQRKQLKLEDFKVEDLGTKSLPFPSHTRQEKVMKRKKRKRVEDTIDKAAYMAHHNLFSYFGNRRSDVASIDVDWGNLGVPLDKKINAKSVFGVGDEPIPLEFRDGDSLEQVLWKIGVAQSHVSELKNRLNKVTSENAGKISSANKLSLLVPCNEGSARNHASPPNNGDRMLVGSSYIASQLMPENNMGLVMPESAVSSHGEVTQLPDITESTDWPQVGSSCRNSGDEYLIYNRIAKEELNNFDEVKIQPIEKFKMPREEQESTIPSAPVVEDITDDQPTQKMSSISKLNSPKNKRKRARRKAGRWSR